MACIGRGPSPTAQRTYVCTGLADRRSVRFAPMHAARPHYLLFTESSASADANPQWRFVLQSIGGDKFLAADDVEPGTPENRLELLAVVRGLEALDEPSRVTLLTASRYVNRGIRRGLSQWRERKWRWERFGQLVADSQPRSLAASGPGAAVPPCGMLAGASVESTRCDELATTRGNVSTADEASSAESKRPRRDRSISSVPRWRFDDRESTAGPRSPFFRTLNRLRQGVLAPLAAIWRPAFTRAA